MAIFFFYKKLKITTKFILWFLIVALTPLAMATYVSYTRSQRLLQKEVTSSLRALADNKAYQIETYLREKEKNVTTLSHMAETITMIERYSQAFDIEGSVLSEGYQETDAEFRPFLEYYEKSLGYNELFLVRPTGEIVFSIKSIQGPRSLYEMALGKPDSELAKVFLRTIDTKSTEISDFEYYKNMEKAAVYISAPVFRGADLIGVVILEMDNKGICELVADYANLGDTGEAAVATKIGNEIVFITPLRFDPHAAFIRRVPIGSTESVDIQKAVNGEKGYGVLLDYRGEKALTVWRHLPLFRMGLVVKMDTTEVFSSAEHLKNALLIISAVLMVLVILMAVLIAHSISGPIRELTEVSSTITGGDLSARAKITSADEIGVLAHSFNRMTTSLVEAKANVEQKKAEVEEQKGLLEKANKELDSFVYTASHDLRAPLRGVASFANFLEEDYKEKLDKEGKDYLKEIREGTERMNRLIDDLLKLSRISRIKNPYEDVDINTLLGEVIKRLEYDIKQNNVDLNVKKGMPTVRCDRIKITEVFLNLINNAIKYSSKKEKNPKVEVGYGDEGELHKFWVRDNGIGIDPKFHEQVFGMFKRLHTADEYEGTGAGLGIVKKIIDDHNGRIWVESEAGKGSTFLFTLPKRIKEEKKKIGEILVEQGLISKDDLEKGLKEQGERAAVVPPYEGGIAKEAPPPALPALPKGASRPLTILLVDDSKTDAKITLRAFDSVKEKSDIRVVESGGEALDFIHNNGKYADRKKFPTPDVILLDIEMPGMDGFEVLQKIKADNKYNYIPVIMLTSTKSREAISKSYKFGAAGFIPKPIDYEMFVNIVDGFNYYWRVINKLTGDELNKG